MTDNIVKYWDREWRRRYHGDFQVECNAKKAKILVQQLWSRGYFFHLNKLEIGCGIPHHTMYISSICKEWGQKYTGIDISPEAVSIGKNWGFNIELADIIEFESDQKFDLFIFLDVLEHIKDHDAVALAVCRLKSDKFHIFGNVPLYRSEHEKEGGFERSVNIKTISRFMSLCGIKEFRHHIYGIDGWPYMRFEGCNHKEYLDENFDTGK